MSEDQLKTDVEETLKERGAIYGDPVETHRIIGELWSTLLSAHYQYQGVAKDQLVPIPPALVAKMMMGLKLIRMSLPFKHDSDSFLDLKGYCHIAELCDLEEGTKLGTGKDYYEADRIEELRAYLNK